MRVLLSAVLLISYFIGSFFSTSVRTETSSGSILKAESVMADTLVKMERTICFGFCPSYELTILDDGNVSFLGKEHVELKGYAEGIMSQENLDKLIQKIQESHFMDVASNPECESRYTDMPSVFLTIRLEGERNSVTHYHGCKGFQYEENLYDLEEAIDSLAGTKNWIGEMN